MANGGEIDGSKNLPVESRDRYESPLRSFHVEFHKEARKTVMNLLEKSGDTQDGSLSFYMHSACGQGICGRCAVKVNGKVRLACNTVLTGEDIVLEPANEKVVKDLVVEN
ncbi:MAG: 2Fe-2S iron-sulfur cluster-binding protein [Clostridium sp.]